MPTRENSQAQDLAQDLTLPLSQLGLTALRPGQREIIEDILNGKPVVAVMPTGAGKSLCYQLPSLILGAQNEKTLVVSPLIALMKDQVDSLVARGIKAGALTSSEDAATREEVLDQFLFGDCNILYVAPERFRNARFMEKLAQLRGLGLLAIDEAHCISEWGHDFRPEYRRLGQIIATLQPKRLAAFTATATPDVRKDIATQLGVSPEYHVYGFDRPNLHFQVDAMAHSKDRIPRLIELIRKRPSGVAVVYAATRKRAEEYQEAIVRAGLRSGCYHAGLNDDERKLTQERFMNNQFDVIVATSAFGMGVDKGDVRLVIHADMPRTVEAYYQEAGRAGRDGGVADVVLLLCRADIRFQQFVISAGCPSAETLRAVWKHVREQAPSANEAGRVVGNLLGKDIHDITVETSLRILEKHGFIRNYEGRLVGDKPQPGLFPDFDPEMYGRREQLELRKFRVVLDYTETTKCRRAFLMSYFGDQLWTAAGTTCGNCDRCLSTGTAKTVMTEDTLKTCHSLLSCVLALDGRLGRKRLIDFAKGGESDGRFADLPERGVLKRKSTQALFEALRWLEHEGYVEAEGDEYPTIKPTPQGEQWIIAMAGKVLPPKARKSRSS